MLSSFKIPKKNSVAASIFKPVLPLLPEVIADVADKGKKPRSITMELSSGSAGASKYKKNLPYFDDGTPQAWIDLQRDITEVWTQNKIFSPTDRMAIVKAVLRGETLTNFEAAVAEGQKDVNGTTKALTMEIVEAAMAEVTTTTFPHRALDSQK